MEIKTKRLTIRPLREQDWQSIQAIWEDFGHSAYAQYDVPHKSEEADIRAMLVRWEAANRGMDHLFFAVCLAGNVIGYIDFHRIDRGYDSGYCFHSRAHGHGYARESYLALAAYLKRCGAERLTAGTALENLPSVRLLTSLGFCQTGTEKVSFYKDPQGNDIFFDGGLYELSLI